MLLRVNAAYLIAMLFCLTMETDALIKRANQPNIVIILVDDQDLHLDSLAHMPVLQKELIGEGTFFTKHYGHVSQCCPARTTLWTGVSTSQNAAVDRNTDGDDMPLQLMLIRIRLVEACTQYKRYECEAGHTWRCLESRSREWLVQQISTCLVCRESCEKAATVLPKEHV